MSNPHLVQISVDSPEPELDEEDPCWDGYQQVGMKKKNGKKVPNCVPEELEEGVNVEEGVNDPAIFKAIFLAGGPPVLANHLS